MLETDTRPWGEYKVLLDEKYCKVKKITVNPKQRLSYQYHHKRAEIWSIVQGVGAVTIEDIRTVVRSGKVIEIPRGTRHRIENIDADKDLIFIEVQHGDYFGEDDIVRIQDDYRRS